MKWLWFDVLTILFRLLSRSGGKSARTVITTIIKSIYLSKSTLNWWTACTVNPTTRLEQQQIAPPSPDAKTNDKFHLHTQILQPVHSTDYKYTTALYILARIYQKRGQKSNINDQPHKNSDTAAGATITSGYRNEIAATFTVENNTKADNTDKYTNSTSAAGINTHKAKRAALLPTLKHAQCYVARQHLGNS